MKKIIKLLSAVFSLVLALVLFVSCGGGEGNLLDSYLLEKNNTTVSADFTLDKTLTKNGKNYNLTWTSNKENIVISAQDDNYLAKVVRPASGEVTVTLTVKVNSESKDFTVRVAALTAYDFGRAFVFAQNRLEVYEDFNLATETELDGKKATISWAIPEESQSLLSISNNKCIIEPQTVATKAFLKATFTYDGKTSTQTYYVFPMIQKTHEEEINDWYTSYGKAYTYEGYVVAIADPFSAEYKNISLYVQDKDGFAGYYAYRAKCDAETAAKIEKGAYVKIAGGTNSNYNGLIESSGGDLTVDTTKEKKDMSKEVVAFDEYLIGLLPDAAKLESRMVSLTNWKVKAIAAGAFDAGTSPYTLLTLTKGGVDVVVNISKYFKGEFEYTAEGTQAIVTKAGTFAVNSWVSVTGVLGRYTKDTAANHGFQVQVISADGLVAGTEDTATSFVGQKIGAVAKEIETKLATEKVNEKISDNKEFTLPLANAAGDVTVTYTLGFSRVVTLENGKFTVTPTSADNATTVKAEIKSGEFTSVLYFTILTGEPAVYDGPGATKENAMTAAQAIAATEKLADGATSEMAYYITATITSDPTADYCNFNFSADDKDILVYGLGKLDSTERYGSKREIAELPVANGDTITVLANLCKFKGKDGSIKLELTNAKLVEKSTGTNPTPTPTPSNENTINLSVVTLDAMGVTSTEPGIDEKASELKTLIANAKISEIKDLSKVYPGDPEQGPKVNGLKIGSSKAAGTITFVFTENVSKVTLHAYAWSSSKLAKITVNGVEKTLTANDVTGTDLVFEFTGTTTVVISSTIYSVISAITLN